MSAPPPKDIAHLLHEALEKLGWALDPERLAQKLAALNRGLPREDEFAVVCTWLGRCKLVHKLDQNQSPHGSIERFQVPDLLAVFEYEGREVPVLIEVKSSTSETLSFRPDYRDKLVSYAKILRLPMLIAWKHHSMWSLFEIDRMEMATKNYNISFVAASSESLLGKLAGDFCYTLPRGTGLHIRMKKNELLSSKRTGSEIHEEWRMLVEDAYHTDRQGRERRDLSADIEALFYVNDLEENQKYTPNHVTWNFTVGDDENKFAHMALSGLLNWHLENSESLNWREVVGRATPVPGLNNFSETVRRAMKEGVVTHILHFEPETAPLFLSAT
jgi:Holliday junction resolvase